MTTAEDSRRQRYREHLERLKNFRLMDDDFLTKCFEDDTEGIQLVLRIILEMPELEVQDVRTQVFVENLLHRSVRLDVLATADGGRKINVEIQREDRGAGRKRARYNSSMMDANLLEKGEEFDLLPETYVVFITENDVMGLGKPLYHIERYIEESGEKFSDGTHILYVNGAYRDDTPIGKLMHDFSCTDPGEMHYAVLAERTRFFKESKEGTLIMCKAMEQMYEQAGKQADKERQIKTAKIMLEKEKYDLNEIAEISQLPLEEVLMLKEKLNV